MAPPPPTDKSEKGCSTWNGDDIKSLLENEEALEEVVWNGLRMWHLIFLSIAALLSVIILLCCCVKFRIPRTKQEIEADYIRRKILRKFRKRLKAIQNQELDEMDLKKALDKIRAEFKSDTESLAQSDAGFSAATISSTGLPGVGVQGSTYRRASQIQIDISLEELRAHSLGFGARVALALSRLFGRSRVAQSGDKVALTVPTEGPGQLALPVEVPPKKSKSDGKNKEEKKAKKAEPNPEPIASSTQGQGQSTSGLKAPATSEVKGQDKKKKEADEKEKKKLEKEKEKAKKAQLKIENEKLKKSEKSKSGDKEKEGAGGSKDKAEEVSKDKPKDKTDKADKAKEKLEKKAKEEAAKKAKEEAAKKAKEEAKKAKEKVEKGKKFEKVEA